MSSSIYNLFSVTRRSESGERMSVCTEPGTESQVSHAALRLQEGKTAGKHFVLRDKLSENTALCDTLLTNNNWSCFLLSGSNNRLRFAASC